MNLNRSITQVLIVFISLIIFSSCQGNKQKGEGSIWANTSWRQLSGEGIELMLPNGFKPTSRFRIKEDLPIIGKDKVKLQVVQQSVEMLEFLDSDVDMFVDTSKTYRLIIICNIEKIDFSGTDVGLIKKSIEQKNNTISMSNPDIIFGDVSTTFKNNTKLKMARYTTPLLGPRGQNLVYNSVYYLTGDSFTLVVYEFTEDEETIENYLWSTRMG